MQVKIINNSKHDLPQYETEGSAGMDLRANLEEEVVLKPLERKLIKTGLFIELPLGTEAQIRPRSGLAFQKRNYGIEQSRYHRCRLSRRNWGVVSEPFQ